MSVMAEPETVPAETISRLNPKLPQPGVHGDCAAVTGAGNPQRPRGRHAGELLVVHAGQHTPVKITISLFSDLIEVTVPQLTRHSRTAEPGRPQAGPAPARRTRRNPIARPLDCRDLDIGPMPVNSQVRPRIQSTATGDLGPTNATARPTAPLGTIRWVGARLSRLLHAPVRRQSRVRPDYNPSDCTFMRRHVWANVLICRCDTRSHVPSELTDWRAI